MQIRKKIQEKTEKDENLSVLIKKNRDNFYYLCFLTKSILYEKTLKLFKLSDTKIRWILVNSYQRKLKNVITEITLIL